MVMQMGKSSLLNKLGGEAKKVFDQTKAKVEVPQDYGDLPAGVSGVARLVRCGFTEVKEVKPTDKSGAKVGDYWFNAMGVVVDPVWFIDEQGNKVRIAGKQTRIIEAVFDTPQKTGEKARRTQAEHFEWIIRQLKFLLGGTMQDFDVSQIEMVCELLTKQRPYFAFSTSAGTMAPNPQYKKPMVFHNWQGRIDDFSPSQSGNHPMVKDNTGGTAQTNGTAPTQSSAAQAQLTTTPEAIKRRQQAEELSPPEDTFDEFGDIDSLVDKANKGDEKAGAELTALVVKAGVPASDVEDAVDWTAVGVLIKDQQSEGAAVEEPEEEDDDDDDEPITPKIGTVYKYKGKLKKAIDVECVKVNTKQSKCTLKDMSSGKEYPDVPFTDVLPPG